MGTNSPWNWILTVPKAIKMMQVRPVITNFKMTELTVLFLHGALSPIYKSSSPLVVSGGELVFGQESILSGCCLLKESQLFFPPTWPLYWLSRGKQPDPIFGHVRMLSPTDAAEAVQSLRESLVPWHWSLKGALKGHHEEAIPQFEGQRLHLQTHSPRWSWWGLCCLLCPCPPGGWGRPALQGFRALFIVTTKNLVRISFLIVALPISDHGGHHEIKQFCKASGTWTWPVLIVLSWCMRCQNCDANEQLVTAHTKKWTALLSR